MKLHRFWIEFDDAPKWFPLGIGVTAADADEAIAIVEAWCKAYDRTCPTQPKLEVDVDIDEIRERRTLPLSHIGIPCEHGIWYPRVNIGSKPTDF